MLHQLAPYASYGSAIFAIIAAGFWMKSATIKTPSKFLIRTDMSYNSTGRGQSKELDDLAGSLRAQSQWSKYAAATAAIAALLQGMATVGTL